jgi:hypothetical protein
MGIENKEVGFHEGVKRFIRGCPSVESYSHFMLEKGGYIASAKQFHRWTGYMAEHDIRELYENNRIPRWMIDIFEKSEFQAFGKVVVWDFQNNSENK